MKHVTQNRWIWFRTSDLAIVYEQFYDGTQKSYVKLYEGGIKENNLLFTSDFRVPKCSNPFLNLKSVMVEESPFSIEPPAITEPIYYYNASANSTYVNKPSQAELELQKYAKWILDNYDANKDGQLDKSEAQKLWKDVSSYDFSGEIVAQVAQAQQWLSKYDLNRDGQLSFGEIANAL
jgi:hypothetical protein